MEGVKMAGLPKAQGNGFLALPKTCKTILIVLQWKSWPKKTIQMTYCKHFDNSCYHHQCIANRTAARSLQFYLQCTDDDNRSYWNVCNMSFISFSLAVIFIIRLFSTSAFRVPSSK